MRPDVNAKHAINIMKIWTIGKRITVGYAAVLITTIAIGILAYTRLNAIKVRSDSLTGDSLPGILCLTKIQENTIMSNTLLLKFILSSEASEFATIDQKMKDMVKARKAELVCKALLECKITEVCNCKSGPEAGNRLL